MSPWNVHRMACLLVFGVLSISPSPSWCQQANSTSDRWIVSARHEPPFAIKNQDGSWSGLSVEVWNGVAKELDIETEWKEMSPSDTVNGLVDGRVQAAVAINVTAEHEKVLEFTHPIYTAGFGIATRVRDENKLLSIVVDLMSVQFATIVGILALTLFLVGLVVWFFERKKNPMQFGGVGKGIGAAFWWAAVTMTTVGYGDKSPTSASGRAVALVWMFASVFFISIFTAAVTASLHHSYQEPLVRSASDLRHVAVGSVAKTSSADYLDQLGIAYRAYPNADAALEGLADDEVDAIFFESPILRYMTNRRTERPLLRVRSTIFDRQHHAIALSPNSDRRKQINQILLRKLAEPERQRILERYLGN